MEGDLYKNDELDEKARRLQNYQEAIPIVKEHKTIIKTQKKTRLRFFEI